MKFRFTIPAGARAADSPNSARILRAARRLLIRGGFASFSARGVAKQAKMSLGALQYCYRTKQALLAATLEHVVNGYEAGYQARLRQAPRSGEARFLVILNYLIADAWDQDSRRMFLSLWGMSSHDRMTANFLREMYEFHVTRMSGFIGDANPELPVARRRELALHIVAMLEGLMLFSQHPGRTVLSKNAMIRATRAAVLSLIGLPAAPARTRRRAPA